MTRRGLLYIATGVLVALALAVALALPNFDLSDPRVQQGTIAALVVAFGWFAAFLLRHLGEEIGRAERLRDLHRAIYAEIETNLSNLWSAEAVRDHGAGLVERMTADPDFVPFMPREQRDRLFETITSDIHILPRVTIDPIVKYYALVSSVTALADDMRGTGFRRLDQARRIAIFEDYTEMRVQMLSFGRVANNLIGVYAKEGKAAAEAEARRISSRRADRSAP